ncbi:MAG: glycosyltransferase [Hyphomonadaceae bacterium]
MGESNQWTNSGRDDGAILVGLDAVQAASFDLGDTRPQLCCRRSRYVRSVLPVLGALFGIVGLLSPSLFVSVLTWCLLWCFVLLIVLRGGLSIIGARLQTDVQADVPLNEEVLPRYSVLVPLYREAGSVPGLVAALNALDYPADRLEILFLTEEDDKATRDALFAQTLHSGAQVLSLPDGQPRTKPRALNVALARLTGDVVTIYDAEDRPHPDQLKSAAQALAAGGETLACVQAPLFAYNAKARWLSGQWALEYDVHFGLILPALARLGLPIALGGTSNHFRASSLRKAGGWDAWNVTEDADIGLRFARMGERVGVIAPPTQEEAPEGLKIWVNQRSRWIKGYMQTWIVLMRQPVLAARQMGGVNFLASFWLLSGAIGSALVHVPCLVWLAICMMSADMTLPPIGIVLLCGGYGVSAGAAILAPRGEPKSRARLIASFWLYWPLLSWAASIALYELIRAPHIWAKTPHALTRQSPLTVKEAFA